MDEASTFVTEKLESSSNDRAVDEIEKLPSAEAVSEEKEEAVGVVDGEQSEPAEFLSKLDIKVDNIEELPSAEAASEEKEEAVAVVDGEQSEPTESLSKLDIKLDSDNTYSLLVFGTGALLALWLSSAVVSSIDSIPLFPKVMEVVGLAYTVWFSYRYLIFKENRDELLTKIEDIKNHIIGTTDD